MASEELNGAPSDHADNEALPVVFPSIKNIPWSEKEKCRFSHWYPQFRDMTIKSTMVPLPQDFVDYLKRDKLVAPKPSIWPLHPHDPRVPLYGEEGEEEDDDDSSLESLQRQQEERRSRENGHPRRSSSSSDSEAGEADSEPPTFPELENSIQSMLDEMGPCFAKLDWSSCQDASWVSGTSKIETIGDAFLLLQSSTTIHDDIRTIEQEAPTETPCQLVFRKWRNLYPSQEFRLFVVNGNLFAISQRNYTEYYEHLQDEDTQKHLASLISSWFLQEIAPNQTLNQYTVDIYIDRKERIWVLDFSNLCSETKTLLFDISELNPSITPLVPTLEHGGVYIRVTSGDSIRPSELTQASLPSDLQHLRNVSDLETFLNDVKASETG
eukprot:gb/GECG01016768.1/.p1 GENE.gb/GECG01016768.1/~~gb/GECG01016768.1/.p1  ORF type:complete len:382 (+),score=51.47 gb/GECG01016768.1/:1-1146(+)